MEHVISIEESLSREVEIKEAGEPSRGHDQPSSATEELSINCSEYEKFKKLEEARGKLLNRGTAKPKIRKVVLLRDHKNFKSYCEPRVVSFGPIHHDEKKYRLTEEYKLVFADDFIKKSGKCVKDLYEMVKKNIKQLRECYDEEVTEKYNDEALAWILFVDGCATLQFIKSVYTKVKNEFKIENGHVVFMKQDLLLLENQLPYQLLHDLKEMSKEGEYLMKAILKFINKVSRLENDDSTSEKLRAMEANGEPIHLLDLLRKRLITDNTKKETGQSCEDKSSENDQSVKKEEHSLHNAQEPKKGEKKTNGCNSCWRICEKNRSLFRNVQELKAVGIHLKRSKISCLGRISFTKNCHFYPGILQLPPITVDDSTGPTFFNLIAYEMCPDFKNDFEVSSYIAFLDSLIDEAKDVMDLRKAGILLNNLGSDEEVAQLFNGICTDVVLNPEIYKDVTSKIEDYYNNKWKTWISEVLHNHFNSPWTLTAFLAALFAVLATGVSTVYSILSYYK